MNCEQDDFSSGSILGSVGEILSNNRIDDDIICEVYQNIDVVSNSVFEKRLIYVTDLYLLIVYNAFFEL